MQSLKDKRLEELKKLLRERDSRMYGYFKSVFQDDFEGGYPIDWNTDFENLLSDSMDMAYEEGKKESDCPPHNFIPHKYEGNWGGSTPPPNMKCTKCLSTQYF